MVEFILGGFLGLVVGIIASRTRTFSPLADSLYGCAKDVKSKIKSAKEKRDL